MSVNFSFEGSRPRPAGRALAVCMMSMVLVGVVLALLSRQSAARAPAEIEQPAQAAYIVDIDVRAGSTTLAGRPVTYTIVVTNNSPSVVRGAVITDVWSNDPKGIYHIYNGNFQTFGAVRVLTYTLVTKTLQPYISWYLDDLPSQVTGSIVLTMFVPAKLQPATTRTKVGLPGILANVAVITHTLPDMGGDEDYANPMIVGPVMYLTKSYTPAAVRPGRLFTYSLALVNRPVSQRPDSIPATNVIVTERVPSLASFWSAAGTHGATVEYSPTSRVVTWRLTEPVTPGTTANLTLTLRVAENLANAAAVKITNLVADYGFRAAELPLPVKGDVKVTVKGDDVLEKRVQVGPPPPPKANPPKTFPNRIITYTITVYNPFTSTLRGFRVTDTLPYLAGAPYFVYSDTLPAAPFTTIPTLTMQAANKVAWELPPIQGWGVYSFALRVWVPTQADTSGITGRIYYNSLEGRRPSPLSTLYNNKPPEARVRVVPQIVPDKDVEPVSQLAGLPVTYTITLDNVGDTPITNIRITDTLPGDPAYPEGYFVFDGMINGPEPYAIITTTSPPLVAWGPITIPAYTEYVLEFRAIAQGFPLKVYKNNLRGYSPDTYIPPRLNIAGVRILAPFATNKTALPRSGDYIVLGDQFDYQIEIYNIGYKPAAIDAVKDNLPSGFYWQTLPTFETTIDPPAELEVRGSPHVEEFAVDAVSAPVACDKLPKTIFQMPGSVWFHAISPTYLADTWWGNAVRLGGVQVYPHLELKKKAHALGVEPGAPITFTIYITNYTSYLKDQIVVTDTLPKGFKFARMLTPPEPTEIIPGLEPKIVWRNLSVPGLGVLRFTFVATASTTIKDGYVNQVTAKSLADPNICISVQANPKVNVREKKLWYTKTATPSQVGMLGTVLYKLTLTNKGPDAVYNALITDVLPYHIADPSRPFEFVAMKPPVPAGVTRVSANPPAWRVQKIDYGKSLALQFYARANIYPATYTNVVTSALKGGWELVNKCQEPCAPVTVIPGVAMDKVVKPSNVYAGETVVYTITVYNQSQQAVSGLRITDTLPPGFTYVSMVAGPSPVSTAPLIWANLAVANGQSLVLAFRARVDANQVSGDYFNSVQAQATSGQAIPSVENGAMVHVYGGLHITTRKTVYPPQTFAGGSVVYTVRLTNEGEHGVTARVTDTLPVSFTFDSVLPGTPPPDSVSPLVWNSIGLDSRVPRELAFRVNVPRGTPAGRYQNLATVSSAGSVFTGTAWMNVLDWPAYDLRVTKSDGVAQAFKGGLVTYTLTYDNVDIDGVDLGGVVLTDTFSAGLTYKKGSSVFKKVSSNVYAANIGDLYAGEGGVLTMVLQLPATFTGNYITNTARIAGTPLTTPTFEADPANNVATDMNFILVPQVSLEKVVNQPAVASGGSLVYSLTVVNQSEMTLTLRITDVLPAGFVFSETVGGTPWPTVIQPAIANLGIAPGRYLAASLAAATRQLLVWQDITLAKDEGRTFVFRVRVGAPGSVVIPGIYYNGAAVSANGLALTGRDDLAPVEVVDVLRLYDLQLSKDDGLSVAEPGQTLNYALHYAVVDQGNAVKLTNVVVTETIEPARYLTVVGTAWTKVADGVYTYALDELNPGASGNLTFQVQVASNIPQTVTRIVNTARIAGAPSLRSFDFYPANDTAVDINLMSGARLLYLPIVLKGQ